MNLTVEPMLDFIGQDKSIPAIASLNPVRVAGYVTGSSDIVWTDSDWAEFPHSVHVRIDQSASNYQGIIDGTADVGDIESGAETLSGFASAVKQRIANGHGPATAYISGSQANAAHDYFTQEGIIQHVLWWIADWNLSQSQAVSRLGNGVVAVQFASPTSNPNTLVPGSSVLTLATAGCDLSVCDASWLAPGPQLATVPAVEGMTTEDAVAAIKARGLLPGPQGSVQGTVYSQTPGAGARVRPGSVVDIGVRSPQPPPVTLQGIVVTTALNVIKVTSPDNGTTWRKS